MSKTNVKSNEQGFTYIELMIAIVVLLVGITGLVAMTTASVVRSYSSSQQLIAKQYAVSTLESILALRDVQTLNWSKIGNVPTESSQDVPLGVFPIGIKDIKLVAGADGLIGTIDDTFDIGPDKIIGTDDDGGVTLPGFQREILITDICDPVRPSQSSQCAIKGPNPIMMRRADVKIRYSARGIILTESFSTIISNYLPEIQPDSGNSEGPFIGY